MSGQSRRWRSNIESNKSDFARQVCPEIPGVQFPRDQNIKFHISNFLLKYLPHVSNLYFEKKAQTMLCCHSTIIILLLPPFLLWLCRQLIRHQLWHLLHLPHKVKGQEEDVLTHLFFRLLTKLFIVISGIRMKSPSPTVVWSAMMAAGKIPHCYNCPTVTEVSTACPLRALAVPPGLEPWQLLGRVAHRPLYSRPTTMESRTAASTGMTPRWIFPSSSSYTLFSISLGIMRIDFQPFKAFICKHWSKKKQVWCRDPKEFPHLPKQFLYLPK